MKANSVIDTILGEAGGKTRAARYADMLAIASVITNRADLSKATPHDVVSAKGQFDAYGKSLPKGTEAVRDLAEQAWDQVQRSGPVTNATYYATPSAAKNLPSGLSKTGTTGPHNYYSDPKGRSFATANGYARPDQQRADMMNSLRAGDFDMVAPLDPQQIAAAQAAAAVPAPPSLPAVPSDALASMHPAFRERAQDFLDEANKRGMGLEVASDMRSPEDQASLYAQGRTVPGTVVTNARPGQSFHNFGLAFDVVPSDLRSTPKWSPDDARWSQIGDLAREKGLVWGGNFRSITDMPHIQAPQVSTKSLRAGPFDVNGYAQLSPEDTLAVRGNFFPTPTARPDNLTAAIQPATGARAASELQGYVAPPSSLPSVPSPAMGARAASGLQGYVASPTLNAPVGAVTRSALPDLPSVAPTPAGSITLPGMPPSLATPPSFGIPAAPVANPLAAPPQTPPPAATPFAPPAVPNTRAAVPPAAMPATPRGMSISLPSAVPATTVTTTPAGLVSDFPEAPPSPGKRAGMDAMKGAAKGLGIGGIPGAIMGGILGPALGQMGRNKASNALGIGSRINPFNGILGAYKNIFGRMPSLPGLGGIFGGMTPNYGATPYGIGSGYGAIGSAFGGPAGATAYSRSNPEVSFTSLGNGMVSRSNSKTGVSYTMGAEDYDPGTSGGRGSSGKGGSSSSGKGSSGKGGGLF